MIGVLFPANKYAVSQLEVSELRGLATLAVLGLLAQFHGNRGSVRPRDVNGVRANRTNLPEKARETLEALRLLTNLETEKRKLLQVVLFGQPAYDTFVAVAREILGHGQDAA